MLLDDDAGDGSEDVADASPITPPEAFDLVLQDVTLNIGGVWYSRPVPCEPGLAAQQSDAICSTIASDMINVSSSAANLTLASPSLPV